MKLFALAAVLGLALAAPRVHMGTREHVAGTPSSQYQAGKPASPDTVIPLMFAVKQNPEGLASLPDRLMAVSDPKSPTYGQHYSLADLKEILADEAATAAVTEFISHYPLVDSRVTPNGEFVSVKVTVETAEQMLDTKFEAFAHKTRDVVLHRAMSYSLPAEVAAAVDFVGHVITLPNLSHHAVIHGFSAGTLRGADAAGQATISVISQYYGITQNEVQNKKATNAVFETIGQSYAPADLTKFDQEFNVPAQTVAKVIGPNNPTACSENPNNCVEAELDVQVITGIAQEGSTTFWSIPGDESFLQWMEAVAADANPPFVHSISYGSPEHDSFAGQDDKFDQEVMKMGMRGLSVLVASGDDGVAGSEARSSKSYCGFNPSYPATAPHVTAVGATQGPETSSPEIACQSQKGGGITSGGGFSNIYGTPSWQQSDVNNYLKNGPSLPPSGQFNSSGRGYPDVALMGHNYPIVVGGSTYAGSGTSASTPVFAGMLTLINSARLSAGKSTVGFANPALYGFDRSVYHDITSGINNCCAGAGSPTCCQYGFTATTGWDPITGLGSPKFQAFKSAFVAL